jgi:hypothetical protein
MMSKLLVKGTSEKSLLSAGGDSKTAFPINYVKIVSY